MNVRKAMWWGCVLLYFALLAAVVFGGRSAAGQIWNLDLFLCYREAFFAFARADVLNIVGNLLLLLPFSFLLSFPMQRSRSRWVLLPLGVALSIGIECTQWLTGVGIADVDDIFNNALGVLSGYVLFSALRSLRQGQRARAAGQLAVAALPFAFLMCAYGFYLLKPYGNTVWDIENGRNITLQFETALPDTDALTVYRLQPGSERDAYAVAERIFTATGSGIGDDCTVYSESVVLYDTEHRRCLWYALSDGTYEYTDIPMLGDPNVEPVGESQARTALESFGVSVPQDARFEADADGAFTFLDTSENAAPPLVTGAFRHGHLVRFRWGALQLAPIAAIDSLSAQTIAELAARGRFHIDEADTLSAGGVYVVTACEIAYSADTKGFYRPYYHLIASQNGEVCELYCSAYEIKKTIKGRVAKCSVRYSCRGGACPARA